MSGVGGRLPCVRCDLPKLHDAHVSVDPAVRIRIDTPAIADSDEPLHLCSLCFRRSVAQVIQATLLTPEVWTALEGGGG